MASACRSLTVAGLAASPGERYAAAHLAALRAAAALVAASRNNRETAAKRTRVRSVWVLLPQAAPDLSEWAEFFAAGAPKRAAAEAGVACVSDREADDLVRAADAFVARIAALLGMAHQPAMTDVLLQMS